MIAEKRKLFFFLSVLLWLCCCDKPILHTVPHAIACRQMVHEIHDNLVLLLYRSG